MRRRFAYSLLLIALFAATQGCRSPGSPLAANPFGAEEQVADSGPSNSKFLSSFQRSRNRRAAATSEPSARQPAASEPSRQLASSGQAESGFDAETQALIDRKLASATPEQQAQMRRDLQGVPPHLIPQVLNAFHLGQQLNEPAAAENDRAAYGHAAPSMPPDRPREADGYQHLANVDPQSRFAPPQPSGGAGDASHGYEQPPQTFPGQSRSVTPAAYAATDMGARHPVQQADWNGPQSAADARLATRLGDYQPPGQPHQNVDTIQAQYRAPEHQQNPADDLPIYQKPGSQQPGRAHVGTLTPGDFAAAGQLPPANLPSAAQGIIQQTNVTMANNAPVSLPSAVDRTPIAMAWRAQLGQMIAMAEREVAQLRPGMNDDSPASRDFIENNVYLRMLYLMSDQPAQQARAWEPIPGIDPAQQEFWQYTLYGMSNYFDRNPQLVGPERYSEAVKSFSRATNKLRSLANLEIGDIALCSSVTNFGNYKRIEPEEFSPGQQVVLYAEIRNFTTRLTDDNSYQTMLAPTIEFLIPGTGPMGGRSVHNAIEMQPTEDLCKYPRRDFFIASLFSIPRDLAQGRYVLKLTVTDKLGQKFAESTLNFKVK